MAGHDRILSSHMRQDLHNALQVEVVRAHSVVGHSLEKVGYLEPDCTTGWVGEPEVGCYHD